MKADTSWAVVASYSYLQEAYIAKGVLEDADIPVVVQNATISTVYPMTMTWAPIKLLVPEQYLERAKELISEVY